MAVVIRFLSLCAGLLVLPAITAAQPTPLTVQRVWMQDTGGNNKTTFFPGETIQFAAQLNNSYGGYLLAANGTQLIITTSFYNDTKPVDIPPGISTWTWNATAPSGQGNYTVTVKAYDHASGTLPEGSASFAVKEGADATQSRIEVLEQWIQNHPLEFDWNVHNELRHLYSTKNPPDLRKAMEHTDVILQHKPMDEYILNILSGWQIGKDTLAAVNNLKKVTESYSDLRFLVAACSLEISDLLNKLPWTRGEEWYYTAGPHYGGASKRSGIDFASDTQPISCPAFSASTQSTRWVIAAAAGKVVRSGDSIVEIEHTGGLRTGYMHLADIQVQVGNSVQQGDRLGHPSCAVPSGGSTTGVHLHFYFKQNEEHISADGRILSGWTIHAAKEDYEGTMTKQNEDTRTGDVGRCAPNRSDLGGCKLPNIRNDLISDNGN